MPARPVKCWEKVWKDIKKQGEKKTPCYASDMAL